MFQRLTKETRRALAGGFVIAAVTCATISWAAGAAVALTTLVTAAVVQWGTHPRSPGGA
jgi:hypothetical protein